MYTDDVDDGMGLPVQPSPTDDERRVCKCRPRPTPPITVSFKAKSFSAVESDGNITFTIQLSQPFNKPFSVEFCTQNSDPVSVKGKPIILLIYKIDAH